MKPTAFEYVRPSSVAEAIAIESVHIPKLSARGRWGYAKFCRTSGEVADSIAAAVRDPAAAAGTPGRGEAPV